jgi:glyoxylase-like metal-dependent hydrolase (beta-lactamase superfamily II)
MVNESDATRAYSAEVHILFTGYAQDSETPAVSQVASTIGFVRDGAIKVIIDPGMLPDQSAMLAPLAALGESPTSITDVVFSHHHPDHTLNAALFPNARVHDY